MKIRYLVWRQKNKMETIIVCVMVVVSLIGAISTICSSVRLRKRLGFVAEFNSIYLEFTDKHSRREFDSSLYNWLVINMDLLQLYAGSTGIMVKYIAPYQQYSVSNYSIIVNIIPKFRSEDIHQSDINFVHDCILRLSGKMSRSLDILSKQIRNPIIWFRNGIRETVGFPLTLLAWFGLAPTTLSRYVKSTWLFKILTGVLSLVAFLSGLITIIAGYDELILFLEKLIK